MKRNLFRVFGRFASDSGLAHPMFDGGEQIVIQSDGKLLIGCHFYDGGGFDPECRGMAVSPDQSPGAELYATEIAGDDDDRIGQAGFFNASSIGLPAVPPGSPSSLDFCFSADSPSTHAEQLCLASKYLFYGQDEGAGFFFGFAWQICVMNLERCIS